jgi:hypothetical protein
MVNKQNLETLSYLFAEEAHSSEADLIGTVLGNLEHFLSKPDPYVGSQEVGIGAGTVDIVLGAADIKNLLARVANENVDKLDGLATVILSRLYLNRSLRASSIAKRVKMELGVVEAALERLLEWELCIQPTWDTYVRAPITAHLKYLVSIEGKLQHWKMALIQACRNRLFSTVSYVVLDAHYSRPAIKALEEFKARNIGLAVARSGEQSILIIHRPAPEPPISNVFEVMAKEAITARLKKNEVVVSKELQDVVYG